MNLNVSKYEEFIFKKILLELDILNSKGFPINIQIWVTLIIYCYLSLLTT